MNATPVAVSVRRTLIKWYEIHQRDLPWRQTQDPYFIWLSEIILQQTRIEQGLSYYLRFVATFPTVKDLADAPLTEVLKCWQGLGYYSRARNLHETAKHIAYTLDGGFPNNYTDLLALKGIGSYTAAAIASFSYKQVCAVLDGNVFRVLARLFLIDTPIYSTAGKKAFTALADQLIDPLSPDTYNQAIMEFGALQCTPSKPDCPQCPLSDVCLAHQHDAVSALPVRKAEMPKRTRYFYYFVCRNADTLWLKERLEKDIWQHLWEFPLVETAVETPLEQLLGSSEVMKLLGTKPEVHPVVQLTHILSHQRIEATFIPVTINATALPGYRTFSPAQLEAVPVSRLIDKYLTKAH